MGARTSPGPWLLTPLAEICHLPILVDMLIPSCCPETVPKTPTVPSCLYILGQLGQLVPTVIFASFPLLGFTSPLVLEEMLSRKAGED